MKTLNRYRWGACNGTETQLWSRIYDDFYECYDAYVQAMKALHNSGMDLSLYKWRGVYNLDQAALLVNDKNIYTDRLYVQEAV